MPEEENWTVVWQDFQHILKENVFVQVHRIKVEEGIYNGTPLIVVSEL